MPLPADLLTPIPGANPAGVYLAYDSADDTYARIQQARREEVVGSLDGPARPADQGEVIRLAAGALAARTKDLQLAAWLAEALLKRDGFAGLREGLGVLLALVERFWDVVYPEPEDGDLELRTAPLGMIATGLLAAVRLAPLTPSGYGFLKYAESRDVGYEADADDDEDRRARRAARLADGQLAAEDFDRAVSAAPMAFYEQLVADLGACLGAVDALERAAADRAGDAAPSFGRLRDALGEVALAARALCVRRRAQEPGAAPADAPAPPAPETGGARAVPMPNVQALDGAPSGAAPTAPAPVAAPAITAPAIPGGPEGQLVAAAHALRRARPHDPAPYLALRGLRWGELRAGVPDGGPFGSPAAAPAPTLLEAPPTAVRAHLKTLALAERWAELLDAAEQVMGAAHGRGWLDLQRHVLAACAGLGTDYDAVAHAVRGALGALLADFPGLPGAALMDDTPAAGAETRRWLAAVGLAPASDGATSNGLAPADEGAADDAPAAYTRALAAARGGRPERGVALLADALARERSPRGRYLRKTEIAAVMVEAGLDAAATPILEELIELAEAHKLEAWEAGDVVARPIVLLCRCLDRAGGDADARRALYLRACRLDPLEALTLPGGATAGA
ncbi:hypothetical protein tb265_17610 [Gemmatimonadetes bacterium T265]|nr:hypothetical protein tb265_17610 [Gemmatimonadetes bacterium T265]